jgi:predicted  nucleic acid-binding Zn-ribbon protein
MQERLVQLESDRARLAATVPEGTLNLYQRLLVKKGDVAVVAAEGEVCGGCHMRAPAQTLIQLRAEKQMTQCPNCGRILYRIT